MTRSPNRDGWARASETLALQRRPAHVARINQGRAGIGRIGLACVAGFHIVRFKESQAAAGGALFLREQEAALPLEIVALSGAVTLLADLFHVRLLVCVSLSIIR